jgi:hypothetical protein
MLFSGLPSVPPDDMIDLLVTEFFSRFHAHIPFLRFAPRTIFHHPTASQYLVYGVACLGSTLSDGAVEVAKNLFSCSTRLITGTLEIDNRVARTLDLVAAV